MHPDQALIIYEIRALTEEAMNIFDQPGQMERLGPELAGLHWEADFAFVFFKELGMGGKPSHGGQDGKPPHEVMATFLRDHPELDLRHIHNLTYAQWQDGAEAAPFTVGGLTVAPAYAAGDYFSEASAPGRDSDLRLIIDPGLAFGFGGHPTTHSCLQFLARACEGRGLGGPPRTALDLGSGTGVLSLAAALWGVQEVVGVDYSHLAVEAARRNIALNRRSEKSFTSGPGLENRVKFHRAPAQDFAAHAGELLMANLHLSLQQELFRLGAFHRRRLVIVSGLLPAEGDLLLADLTGLGLKLVDQVRTDRWISLFLSL